MKVYVPFSTATSTRVTKVAFITCPLKSLLMVSDGDVSTSSFLTPLNHIRNLLMVSVLGMSLFFFLISTQSYQGIKLVEFVDGPLTQHDEGDHEVDGDELHAAVETEADAGAHSHGGRDTAEDAVPRLA
ncbi:hypothetical protein LAZ67_21002692 [Cordylochernes scorpioides]|uniref:Uncharacterized protein n=1 Tax=Cordylochernes scorpioides TaxID=51811 RepID=A0ABY6LMS4_9ARAC|nr:hypothetical protein LAZ67_21002692 [Cordylochernes scorpioides]